MNLAAVICELNPLHNGHAYLLARAKALTGCDAVLCIMSGQFVQRTEPAVLDMRERTRMALQNGADAVIELPALYATACGERFSEGAIAVLNAIPSVKHLVFGSESGDLAYLQAVANIQLDETDAFKRTLLEELDSGKPYAAAYAAATSASLGLQAAFVGQDAPRFPNDLLAVAYCKQLARVHSNIAPVTVLRQGAGYHDKSLAEEFCSATAIRDAIACGDWDSVQKAMPSRAYEVLQRSILSGSQESKRKAEAYNLLVMHALRSTDLSQCADAGNEGLATKLKKAAQLCTDLDRVIQLTKSKRYTESRIRRLCLQALLSITHYPTLCEDGLSPLAVPAKLLGVKKEWQQKLLGELPNHILIQNRDFVAYCASLSASQRRTAEYIYRINQAAASVYALAAGISGDPYNGQPLLVV